MRFPQAVALITGGAQGLGRMFAGRLLERGTKVIVADMNVDAGHRFVEEVNNKYGPDKMKFLKCDVTNSKELSDKFEEAKDAFGRLDIICNNAGIMTTDPARSRLQVDVNVTAVIEGTYKGIELMSTRKGGDGGVIVNVGSAAGLDLMINAAVFSSTKHAVVAFSRSFKRLPNHKVDGVRVNCVCPYFCETQMVTKAIAENPENERIIRSIGMVNVEDVAEGFLRCVSDDDLNAGVVVVAPNRKIFEMKFGMEKM